jgi:hypothetical protein
MCVVSYGVVSCGVAVVGVLGGYMSIEESVEFRKF